MENKLQKLYQKKKNNQNDNQLIWKVKTLFSNLEIKDA